MKNIIQSIKDYFKKREPLPVGFYSYHSPAEDPLQYRLHLRTEKDGSGLMIVNASTVLHLNQTATEYAYELVQGTPQHLAIKHITDRYFVKKKQINEDYQNFHDQILTLVNTPDLDPISYLGMDRQMLYSDIAAPYRLDCALTYKGNQTSATVAPFERVSRELSTDEWKVIIKKIFEAGIPHVIFTGGEATLREDLVEILNYCEVLGLVTGLLSDGLRLSDPCYLNSLLESGLDHLMLVPDPEVESFWPTLQRILNEDIYTTVHLTLTPGKDLLPYLNMLTEMKVNAISLSTSTPALEEELNNLENYVASKLVELVWDIPVPYSRLNPIALELEPDEIREGAGSAWFYVEPDGDVLPAQGINQVLGNILTDTWNEIWENRSNKE